MKLYLDEHFNPVIAAALQERGIDAISTEEAGNKGLTDEEVLEFAASTERHLITRDVKDFQSIANRWISEGKRFPKILFITKFPLVSDVGLCVRSIASYVQDQAESSHPIKYNTVNFIEPVH